MSQIFLFSLWRARGRIVALTVGFALFELIVALSYASVDQNAVRQLVDSLPPALVALAGSSDLPPRAATWGPPTPTRSR